MFFVAEAGLAVDPLEREVDVVKDNEGRGEGRLVVVLDHQEVDTVLPDLDRVALHLVKHVSAKQRTQR